MNKKNFDSLLSSVKEAGGILRGERAPSREFYVRISSRKNKPKTGYVLCVETDDPELLIVSKVYKATFLSSNYVHIIDEAGEAAIYPDDYFIALSLDSKIEEVLEQLQAA